MPLTKWNCVLSYEQYYGSGIGKAACSSVAEGSGSSSSSRAQMGGARKIYQSVIYCVMKLK